MQLKYSTHRKNCFASSMILYFLERFFDGEIRWISFPKNQNFDKTTQPIWMKLPEKHAIKVFYTQKKFQCFVYDTLLFIMFFRSMKFGEFLFAKIQILKKVLNLFDWNCQKSMQLKYSTHRKNFIASSMILYFLERFFHFVKFGKCLCAKI